MLVTIRDKMLDAFNRLRYMLGQNLAVLVYIISSMVLGFLAVVNDPGDPWIMVLVAVLNFGSYDVLGFTIAKKADSDVTVYRVLQVVYQAMLCHLLWSSHDSLPAVLAFVWLWWWGVCDLLYYLIGNWNDYQFLLTGKNFYWLWWTPYGLLGRSFNWTPSGRHLIYFSVLSILLYFVYLLFF